MMFRISFTAFLFLTSFCEDVMSKRDRSSNSTEDQLMKNIGNVSQSTRIFHSVTTMDGSIVTINEAMDKKLQKFPKFDSRMEETIVDINSRFKVKGLVEGDILLPTLRNSNRYARKWTKTRRGVNKGLVEIPYVIEKDFNHVYQNKIKSTFPWFSKHTCVRLVPKRKNGPHVRLRKAKGCYAYVGMSRSFRGQPVGLHIPGCLNTGTILHELMHVMGFEHEQSRYDRDKYVQINLQHVDREKHHNFRKQRLRNLVVYDYGSVLHYSSRSFAKEPFYKSIEVLADHVPKPKIGQKRRLSPYDIEEIKYLYNCEPGTYERCGKDFINKRSGSFESPNYPNAYPKESHCTWKITARRGQYVKVTFSKISIRYSSYCQDDAILIHDGLNAGAPVLRRICGRPSDIEVTSSDRSMFVIFSSDTRRDVNTGFKATFTETSKKGTPPAPKSKSIAHTIQPTDKTTESLQCNFEQGTCGIYQEKLDEMDWIRQRGRTRLSRYTGPSADHTNGNGYYFMLNAGGWNLETADVGIIRTPWFIRSRTFYIKFNYHMFGYRMGALDFYAYELKNDKSNREVLLFQKFRDQKNKWHDAEVTYKPQRNSQFVHFYWKAYRNGWSSVVALDDIEITTSDGNTPGGGFCTFDETQQTTKNLTPISKIPGGSSRDLGEYIYPKSVSSHFLCGWKQLRTGQDKFDWTRNKGQTKTKGTGPRADHTTYKGYYMYIESSRPRNQNDIAVLQTPSMFPSKHCISMYYHMYGRNIGRLVLSSMQYLSGGKQTRNILKSINGPQRGVWLKLQVDYSPRRDAEGVAFRIEGAVGKGERGDIAIDDVAVLPGACDACEKPNHRYTNSFEKEHTFITGCLTNKIFWVRCCSSDKPQVVYRNVEQCDKDMFRAERLNWYCVNL